MDQRQRFMERPLTPELRQEIDESIARGKSLLSISTLDTHETIVSKVDKYVYEITQTKQPISDDHVIALGCMWGEQFCQDINWHWATLIEKDDTDFQGIVSPERRCVIFPIHFINKIINGLMKDPYYDNTIHLTFNMAKESTNFEDTKPGDYQIWW